MRGWRAATYIGDQRTDYLDLLPRAFGLAYGLLAVAPVVAFRMGNVVLVCATLRAPNVVCAMVIQPIEPLCTYIVIYWRR